MPPKEPLRPRSGRPSHARRRPPLGQHFLTDRRIEQRIVTALALHSGDVVLEIGAGRGNMTERLAAQAAKLIAVEVDPKLAALLRQKFEAVAHIEVRQADILQVPIDALAREAGRRQIKVYGNLPYYITSPCLLHLLRYHEAIEEIVVMVQEEVARRITARPGSSDYGLLSLTCQYYSDPELLFSVGPQAFSPPPKVRSAVVRMPVQAKRETLGIRPDEEPAFWALLRRAFAQKRKTLFNNLRGVAPDHRLRIAMEGAGVEAQARAETLSLMKFSGLFRALNDGCAAGSVPGGRL